jgi:cysteinyl-tRNA synthetase
VDFAEEKIEEAEGKLEKIRNTTENLQIIVEKGGEELKEKPDVKSVIEEARKNLIEAMDNNFNSADALAVIFDYVRSINDMVREGVICKTCAGELLSLFEEFEEIFGVNFIVKRKEELTAEQKESIAKREEARAQKDWKKADEIREKLKSEGIILEDSQSGTVWKKVK